MAPQNLRAVGDRIEQLLDDLHAGTSDARVLATAEELLRSVTELYGGGLERIVQLASEHAPAFVPELFGDELVRSLLIVHGLDPDPVDVRVERALESVRPLLAQHDGDVELLEVDPAAAAVHLRLLGSCDGCASSTVTLQVAIEAAINEAAPEITIIDVETPAPTATATVGVPVTIGPKPTRREPARPVSAAHPTEVANA
jgi:Fe-S cluster biogenesis protein NfuA